MNLFLRTKSRTVGMILSATLYQPTMFNLGLHVKGMLGQCISNYQLDVLMCFFFYFKGRLDNHDNHDKMSFFRCFTHHKMIRISFNKNINNLFFHYSALFLTLCFGKRELAGLFLLNTFYVSYNKETLILSYLYYSRFIITV